MNLTQECNTSDATLSFCGFDYIISRSHPEFGLVIKGQVIKGQANIGAENSFPSSPADYLHQHLLSVENREAFYELIATEGLVVCQNVKSEHPGYRKVRGKSSSVKLSQAEYYHHDGCSCPQNPLIVEIRLPYQEFNRNVATAIAPFPAVMRAMLQALPDKLKGDQELVEFCNQLQDSPYWNFDRRHFVNQAMLPHKPLDAVPRPVPAQEVSNWDKFQGRIIRRVRREMDAESCRAYYREVDQLSGAFVSPWSMGESRLMLNHHEKLELTLQHRRAHQKTRQSYEQNGHLVKRWTAEEI